MRRASTWRLAGLIAAGLGLSLFTACGSQPLPASDAAARMNGSDVPYASFESYLERNTRESGSSLPSAVLSQLFDQFLDEMLLTRLATDKRLIPDDTSPRLAVAALLSDKNGASVEPSAPDVESYYRQHLDQFQRPERVRLRQILVEDRETAELAASRLAGGAPFPEVARQYSIDSGSGGGSGGDQGLLARSDLPVAFASTIFSLTPGQVSDIIPAEYGFHIFLVEERLPAKELPLNQAEPEIRQQLRRDLTEQRLTDLVREARDQYEPEIFVRNLPFNYQGRYSDAV